MDETTNRAPDPDEAPEVVGNMAWLRRVRDDFAARTAALSPEDLAEFLARAAAAARMELVGARKAETEHHLPTV